MLVREFSSFANKRPAGRCRRPRWQLKFHFNPKFPQYFSIPPGLVALSVVLRRRQRASEFARAAKIGTPVQREQKSKWRHKKGKNRAVEEEREVNV